ncbi:MAG: DUF1566 domain-containing protein [Rikenellaceae bacterium]|nr:DUF1566 domain-containing protein [Rikenellaceae bacterium]
MKNIYLLLTLVGVMLTSTLSDASAQRTPSYTISDHEYCDQHLTINVTQPCAHQGTTAPYKVGDYYNVNGKQGVVFEVCDNGRHGKIVSLDDAFLRWCTFEQYDKEIDLGLRDENNGKVNTDKVMQRRDSDQYPAFVWCRNKGADWYLPAYDELKAIYNSKSKINSTLAKYDAELNGWYWSSTEYEDYPESRAWYVYMSDGYTVDGSKYANSYVRAVSVF